MSEIYRSPITVHNISRWQILKVGIKKKKRKPWKCESNDRMKLPLCKCVKGQKGNISITLKTLISGCSVWFFHFNVYFKYASLRVWRANRWQRGARTSHPIRLKFSKYSNYMLNGFSIMKPLDGREWFHEPSMMISFFDSCFFFYFISISVCCWLGSHTYQLCTTKVKNLHTKSNTSGGAYKLLLLVLLSVEISNCNVGWLFAEKSIFEFTIRHFNLKEAKRKKNKP